MCRVCGAASSIPIVFTLNCLLVHPAFLAACLLQLVSDISTRWSPWPICHWAKPMSGPFPVLNFLMTLQPMTCWSCLLWTIDSLSISILHLLGFLTGLQSLVPFLNDLMEISPIPLSVQKPPRWRSQIHDLLELLGSLCRHSLKPQTLHVQNLIFLSISPHTLPAPTALSLICLFLLIMLPRLKMTGSLPDSITCYILSRSIPMASPIFSFSKVPMATPLFRPLMLRSLSSGGAWLPCHQFPPPVMLSD